MGNINSFGKTSLSMILKPENNNIVKKKTRSLSPIIKITYMYIIRH